MAHIAYFTLILAGVCAGYAVVASVVGLKTWNRRWRLSAENACHAVTWLLTLAVLLLLYFLFQRNFRIAYVAAYTDVTLAPIYILSALWAGQEGSLLCWAWLLSLCSSWWLRRYPGKSAAERLYTLLILALTSGFFLTLLPLTANPFQVLPNPPLNGRGMNPLLQNPYMVVHPPVLFIGYAGFVIPFAQAFAALCLGRIGREWLGSVRRWTLFAWYCLGIGIILGARWAYLELGWGGYWSWDPVENASFIPWLLSTALLHTLILQQRRGLLRRWNLLLCILTFSLCVFGTFITRSGILASVHAFAQSPTGWYFLAFLTVSGLCTLGLLAFRWRTLQGPAAFGPLASKEGSFLVATQLMVGLGFAVLYGTVYPLAADLLTGQTVLIGESFFNTISIPLGLAILALIGVCQQLSWQYRSRQMLGRKLVLPLTLAVGGGVLLFGLGIRRMPVLLTCSLSLFVAITLISAPRRTLTLVTHRRVGQLIHLGTAIMLAGIALSSAYQREHRITLAPGQRTTLDTLEFEYEQFKTFEDRQKGVVRAEVVVSRNARRVAELHPEKHFYGPSPEEATVTTEVGLHSSWREDIYVILEGWDEQHVATFTVLINPGIGWIWLGGFWIFSGAIGLRILPYVPLA